MASNYLINTIGPKKIPKQQTLLLTDMMTIYEESMQTLKFVTQVSLSTSHKQSDDDCPMGYTSSENYCHDINECTNNPCSDYCINKMGSYECGCKPGFTLAENGINCIDIDECLAFDEQACTASAPQCKNTIGSYICTARCPAGFEPNSSGNGCRDINECKDPKLFEELCAPMANCINTIGSYYCSCRSGYTLTTTSPERAGMTACHDINECLDENLNTCLEHQDCINTPGGYRCQDVCSIGLRSGVSGCEDINECDVNSESASDSICPFGQTCINTLGSYKCECPIGYQHSQSRTGSQSGTGIDSNNNSCVDINECESFANICQHQCINQPGTFKCKCPSGYKLSANKRQCEDINECKIQGNKFCGKDNRCFNRRGDFTCIKTPCPIKNGYRFEKETGKCLKKFGDRSSSPIYEVVYETVALPFGLGRNVDLLKLTAKTLVGKKVHKNTEFVIKVKSKYRSQLPFNLRSEENGSAILHTTSKLTQSTSYTLRILARSLKPNGKIAYKTTFVIYIGVSKYPY